MTRGSVAKTPYFPEHLLSGMDNGGVLLIKADSGLIDGAFFHGLQHEICQEYA